MKKLRKRKENKTVRSIISGKILNGKEALEKDEAYEYVKKQGFKLQKRE